ncbi:MAG: hypothetical protein ABJA82_08510 [Myxococcales bacterium]
MPCYGSAGASVSQRLAFVGLVLATGCNPLFGIHEGKPRPICAGTEGYEPLIDDMEDGDGFICDATGRHGHWYTISDQSSTDLTPAGNFDPSLIPGRRGTSQYAAHIAGSGFTDFVGMTFDLNQIGLSRQTFDASTVDGIKFWMKSTTPIEIELPTPDILPPGLGGECAETSVNCFNAFAFEISAPSADWLEYEVPFAALRQLRGGSAVWNPRHLYGAAFLPAPGSASKFDVWVDDVRFYRCGADGCLPTCADPAWPVPCVASGTVPAHCAARPDCSEAATVGCNPLNTEVVPPDGLITSFMTGESGIPIIGPFPEVALGPASSAPTVTRKGALRITVNAPVLETRQVLLVDFAFEKCIDASAFTGVQFSISGSLSGCTLSQATQDSAHLYGRGPTSAARYGSGQLGSHPNATLLTADQITSAPQTVMMPFAAQTGGLPETPTDPSKLTFINWVFKVDPPSAGGPTACVADLTIDDVRFY